MTKSKEQIYRDVGLKLVHADRHINDLQARIDYYLQKKHWRTLMVDDFRDNTRSFVDDQDVPVPDELPLILGDAIHNLRSALDIAMFNMIGENAGIAVHRIAFPVAPDAASLDRVIDLWQVREAGPKVVDAIKNIKPYGGESGDALIFGLHHLDIRDKHRLPLIAAKVVTYTNKMAQQIVPSNYKIIGELRTAGQVSTPIPQDAYRPTERWLNAGKVIKVPAPQQPEYQVCFGVNGDVNMQLFQLEPIVPKLREIRTRVDQVANLLIDAFLAP